VTDKPTGTTFTLSAQDLADLAAALGDAYGYRVGEGDPNDPEEEWDAADWQGKERALRLAALFGVLQPGAVFAVEST
jgi:hypothetical protein